MHLRVSVIIPCYRDSATLSRALDSIYAQTRSVDEVIVVNDASPETFQIEAILAIYPNARYLVNQCNLGLAASRNAGVVVSTGEIVCFLDADDEWHPQKIEIQLSLYRPDRALSCSVVRIGDVRGIDHVVTYVGDPKCSVFRSSSKLIRSNVLTGASLMISKELFMEHGGYDENLRSCEDFDLWLRLLDSGIHVFNINLPLYLYRVNSFGLSRNFQSISCWELIVVQKYLAGCRQRGKPLPEEALIYFIWIFRHYVRYEQCSEPLLLKATNRNLALLDPWPMIRLLLVVSRRLGLPKLVGWFRSESPRVSYR